MNEADTCPKYVVPKLQGAGWDKAPHSFHEQQIFTDARVITTGSTSRRSKPLRGKVVENLAALLPSILDKAFRGEL